MGYLTTTLPPAVEIHHPTSVPDLLLSLLTAKPSYSVNSLPVTRRIQFARNFAQRGGVTEYSRVVHVYHPEHYRPEENDTFMYFVTAYVDLSTGPETQVWVFCSMEKKRMSMGGIREFINTRVMGKPGKKGRKILVGSIHEEVRKRMVKMGMGLEKTSVMGNQDWELDDKFIFYTRTLPELTGGMREERWEVGGKEFYWDSIKKEDVGLVKSRTGIDRQEATLLMVPSLAVRLGATGEAVGWGFLGLDGSLMSLHVEEPYRRLGFGKAIAIKLMRERLSEYGNDGIGTADVWVENTKSQALCRAIGGRPEWVVSWGILDLDSIKKVKL
ncbi:hypothetical protein QBC41DRAFT_357443 [Cercophora samala]|uniref:GCN5-related N-acetyltransferase Rv2170-like domain-containing protein n=1 Tax=Cercophora samala TaxID=330535 RepID=A0AA40DB20_9PEZI|nr:hypothetical protein QBC41DRAFT_357443 [Cercophora samala]